MTEQDKWDYIINLDEELLKGGVILSEWTAFLVKDAETAFCSGAYLSSILASQAAIECHLRYEFSYDSKFRNCSFFELINKIDIAEELKKDLHELRMFRNKWVHVKDPSNDYSLLKKPEYHELELKVFSMKTIKTMLRIIYFNQMV